MSNVIILILECIGTIAFSITGVFAAVKSKLDFFGTCFVGCITAVGGGMIRDMLLGITPPLVFENVSMILIALAVSVIVFLLLYVNKDLYRHKTKIEYINNAFDAIGLGVFAIMGAETACSYGYQDNLILVCVTGILTGVGGGMLRDVLTRSIPVVLRKYVYAVAALAGILVFYLLKITIDNLAVASTVAVLIVVTIRLLASKYKWNLPVIHINEGVN